MSTPYFSGRRPRILGHRGAAGVCPENTLVSFRQAKADGADVLEMDVHLTRDKHVVVCHDPTVERTTNGKGRIALMTLAELKQLDAGYNFVAKQPGAGTIATPPSTGAADAGAKATPPSTGVADAGAKATPPSVGAADAGFSFRGKGVTIPTFEEVLGEFPDTPINVEIKANNRELIEAFFALLRKYGRLDDVSVLVAANVHSLVAEIRHHNAKASSFSRREVAKFMLLSRFGLVRLFRPRGGKAFQVPVNRGRLKIVTPSFVRNAHKLGLEVHVWTINDEREMRRLLDMGVDGIFTDHPALMRRLLDERSL
jgi:glycerophosphoryl diester phosphodiesterase